MSDTSEMKLGRIPSVEDHRNFQYKDFYEPAGIIIPPKRLWTDRVSEWGVMGNNRYGNCVYVTAAHMLLCWRSCARGDSKRISDNAVIEEARHDRALNGFSILERNKIWRKRGLFSDRLWAFTSIDPKNVEHVRSAIYFHGCVDLGVNLPMAWQGSDIWDDGQGRSFIPNSWGPHSVPIVGYDEDGFVVVSWGKVIKMTTAALLRYCDEAYACIDSNWLDGKGETPAGLNLESLHAALQSIEQN